MAPRAPGRWGRLVAAFLTAVLFSSAYSVFFSWSGTRPPLHHARSMLESAPQQQSLRSSVALAHNLTANLTEEKLQNLYSDQLTALLQEGHLAWAGPEARSHLCRLVEHPAAQVALVGNGPLSDEQRGEIAKAHCIVRFNALQSRKTRLNERTDLWFIRGTSGSVKKLPPWFIPNEGLAKEVGRGARGIVLADTYIPAIHAPIRAIALGESAGLDAQALHEAVQAAMQGPELAAQWAAEAGSFARSLGLDTSPAQAGKVLSLELAPLFDFWNSVTARLGYTSRFSLPSTGFLALLAVLECLPPDGSIHIFGFNWNSKNWNGHLMQVESSFVQLFSQLHEGRLVVHSTPCSDYRTCG